MEVGGGYRAREGCNRFSVAENKTRKTGSQEQNERCRSTFSLLVALWGEALGITGVT